MRWHCAGAMRCGEALGWDECCGWRGDLPSSSWGAAPGTRRGARREGWDRGYWVYCREGVPCEGPVGADWLPRIEHAWSASHSACGSTHRSLLSTVLYVPPLCTERTRSRACRCELPRHRASTHRTVSSPLATRPMPCLRVWVSAQASANRANTTTDERCVS